MPYIEIEERRRLLPLESYIEHFMPSLLIGDINYIITTIMNERLKIEGTSYKTINELIGVLECAKLELYRKVAAPYEDEKCKTNGEVYHV